MSPKQLRQAVEDALKPLVGRRVTVAKVEEGDEDYEDAAGTIDNFVLSPTTGALYLRVTLDRENRSQVDVTLDELTQTPDEPLPQLGAGAVQILDVTLVDAFDPDEYPPQTAKVVSNDRGINVEDPIHAISLADAALGKRNSDA